VSSAQLGAKEQQQFAFQSFGAQFCEVKIDPQLPRVRVTRFVRAIDSGRVLNLKTCRSQVLDCRGIGEIGITGVAAAVANAVFHATGQRVRDLPITPDKLLS
jgi:xanthine dehydrogenase YagR molybdenum-binding subunit